MGLFSHGILGINKRNLHYILKKNPSHAIRLANNKTATKEHLSSSGIQFAETYALIKNPRELRDFDFDSFPQRDFVIKPNKGSKGKGILICQRHPEGFFVSGEVWSEEKIKLHMRDILEGTFSLESSHDHIIIEEKLIANELFGKYCEHGLADIRVIVYNLIPVIAMLRVPTADSGGKANIAQGGIGIGLSIATGEPISIMTGKHVYHQHIPPEYAHFFGASIPYWDQILLKSAEAQKLSGLGYIALDWVITADSPRLLEINARAGLEIQNATLIPLDKRLEKANGLKVSSPEKGVEIAKVLFHPATYLLSDKQILPSHQQGLLLGKKIDIEVKLDRAENTITGPIALYFEDMSPEPAIITPDITNTKIILDTYKTDRHGTSKVLLGRDLLHDYLIDPSIETHTEKSNSSIWGTQVETLDSAIYTLNQKISLGNTVKPINITEELSKWRAKPDTYHPQFEYRFPDEQSITHHKITLSGLRDSCDILKSTHYPLGYLYTEKIQEIEDRCNLVEAYKNQDFDAIDYYGSKIFANLTPTLIQEAHAALARNTNQVIKKSSKKQIYLSPEEIITHTKNYLLKQRIQNIPVQLSDKIQSRMAVKYGSRPSILINKRANIYIDELPSIFAHEIGTHLKRHISGGETQLSLFALGTGYYLIDEEGLAVYRSLEHVAPGDTKDAFYKNAIILNTCSRYNFCETAETIRSFFPSLSEEEVFYKTLRFKRGIVDTAKTHPHGALYAKDQIYLIGYDRVQKFINSGGHMHTLMYGKIKITDLAYIYQL